MPNLAFLTLAGGCAAGAWWLAQRKRTARPEAARGGATAPPGAEAKQLQPQSKDVAPKETKDLSWDDVVPVDTIGLEVGYKLIPLVDRNQGGQLMTRIKGVRKKLTQELGFLIPSVHIRDNLELPPNGYRITLMGVTVGEAQVFVDREMAINPGKVYGKLDGIPGKDPAFGLEAVWIEGSQRDQAQSLGYTVVDASTVVATHLSDILQKNAHKILGREEVQHLLENLGKTAPKLVEELPESVPPGTLLRILQNLLAENIPIRDLRTIAETLAERGNKSQDAASLTAAVRVALGRLIVQKINGLAPELPILVLAPELERILQDAVETGGEAGAGLEPGLAEKLQRSLAEAAARQDALGQPAVLLVSAPLRGMMARFTRYSVPGLSVLAYNEVPDDKQLRVVASIGK